MSESVAEKRPRAVAVKLTELDRDAIELIKICGGVVNVDLRGNPGLETGTQIEGARYRLRRLEALGVLVSSEDGPVEGLPQTYRLTEKLTSSPP